MSIKDKIAPGKWSFESFGRGKFQRQLEIEGDRAGLVDLSYLNTLEEAEAVFSLILKVPEMLDILERFAGSDLEDFDNLRLDAINLLKQLNQ